MSKAKPKKLDKQWKVLKEAKKLLLIEVPEGCEKPWFQYICWSIEDTGASLVLQDSTKNYLLDIISPYHSVESWMINEIGGYEVEYDIQYNTSKKLQKARHDFVDWMIADCKSRNV